ncbi:unnamed protein product [Rotaria socialis]|uniref:EGF-like domain-containing protein n=1 Tax=Rotaria socialis TaxID=392032 RepID=A0A818ZKF6_9BILA|nr:unnamed protein product [Rotaria socialis]CAF4559482.1 unnamed protein product [Rotaria socialis]
MSNFTVFETDGGTSPTAAFVEFYEHRDHFDYYLLFLRKYNDLSAMEIYIRIQPSRRCRSIHEFFNETIVAQPPLRCVKNYQRPCLQPHKGEVLICFNNEKLMCLCDRMNHADCFNFQTTPSGCPWNTCSGRSIYVQDHESCPTISVCICEARSYGSHCQFKRAGYSLSLDGIIGSHILSTTTNILHQTVVIQISVVILSILITLETVFNLFAIGTFSRPETQDSGCGIYFFVSSCIGLVTTIVLMCNIFIVLNIDMGNISCLVVEFLLKWWPTTW